MCITLRAAFEVSAMAFGCLGYMIGAEGWFCFHYTELIHIADFSCFCVKHEHSLYLSLVSFILNELIGLYKII